MPETKLRAMRAADVLQVVNCEAAGLSRGGWGQYAHAPGDLEYFLRQQVKNLQRLTVAVDCHNIVRGYLHADCGTLRNEARLKRLVVHGDWWKLGVGRQLLESFLVQCRDADVDCVCEVPFGMLPRAANFLKKFSFRGTSTYSVADDDYCTMRWTPKVAQKVGV